MSLESFTDAYIEAALFSATDDEGEPLDSRFDRSDIATSTVSAMELDCADFYEEFKPVWSGKCLTNVREDEQAGHDFWFTRNGHGVGFWEKSDWKPSAGAKLTEGADSFGGFDLYVGDDGMIHGQGSSRRRVKRSSRKPKRSSRKPKRTSRNPKKRTSRRAR